MKLCLAIYNVLQFIFQKEEVWSNIHSMKLMCCLWLMYCNVVCSRPAGRCTCSWWSRVRYAMGMELSEPLVSEKRDQIKYKGCLFCLWRHRKCRLPITGHQGITFWLPPQLGLTSGQHCKPFNNTAHHDSSAAWQIHICHLSTMTLMLFEVEANRTGLFQSAEE